MTPRCITVHCSDSPDGRYVSLQEIRRWHMDPPPEGRGWSDIGYQFVIGTDGSVWPGRSLTTEGAHVQGHNMGNVGICLVGTSRYSAEQWAALRGLIGWLTKQFEIPITEIYCHREFDTAKAQGKTCPGFEGELLRTWFADQTAHPPGTHVL